MGAISSLATQAQETFEQGAIYGWQGQSGQDVEALLALVKTKSEEAIVAAREARRDTPDFENIIQKIQEDFVAVERTSSEVKIRVDQIAEEKGCF